MPECNFITSLVEYYWNVLNYSDKRRFDFYLKDKTNARETYHRMIDVILQQIDHRPMVLKDPELVRLIPAVRNLFPNAVFLCTIRDPRDIFASIKQVRQKQGIEFSIGEVLPAMGAYFSAFSQPSSDDGWVLWVRYEDLCRHDPRVFRSIADKTGLAVQTEGWDYVGDPKDPFHSDLYGNTPTEAQIGSHRRQLSSEEIMAIEQQFGGVMRRFNY
jgi:hypothetical protein